MTVERSKRRSYFLSTKYLNKNCLRQIFDSVIGDALKNFFFRSCRANRKICTVFTSDKSLSCSEAGRLRLWSLVMLDKIWWGKKSPCALLPRKWWQIFSQNTKKIGLVRPGPKSPGPDHMVPCILKSCALELVLWLTYIETDRSLLAFYLTNGNTDITPLHKKGSKSSRENYRPISLTWIVCEIVRKLFLIRRIKFWSESDVINNNKVGFLRGRSTATQLLSTFNDWAKSRNLSIPTDVIFFDLAKDFENATNQPIRSQNSEWSQGAQAREKQMFRKSIISADGFTLCRD